MNNQLAMTTTPHPTDALPLPELPTTSYLGDGNGYGYDSSDMYAYGYIVRREGYELAMSNTRERLAAIAEEFEAAIPTGAGLALAAMIREGVTSLGSHIGYAVRSLAAPAQEQPRPKKAKKQPKCEEGRECEAPDICKSVGRCMRA